MITADQIKKIDDRTLDWYRKKLIEFDEECLAFNKAYCGDPGRVLHNHLQELKKLLEGEIKRRETYYKEHGVL